MRVALGCIAGLTVACGRFGFEGRSGDDASAVLDAALVDERGDTVAAYRANSVRFERTANDYMWTGSLQNTQNSPRGMFSAWLHFNGGDSQQHYIAVAQVALIGGVLRESDNRIKFAFFTCTGVLLLDLQTQNTHMAGEGWLHVLASWDLSIGRAQLYVNDAVDRATPSMLNGNICYDSIKWGIGGLNSGVLDADVADFYATLGTSLDLDDVAVRRRFIDADGKPVPLDAGCAGPTGAMASGCFVGESATWNVNEGTAAGFNLEGDGLADAPTSPSDD